jgi:ribosomal protein L29
MKIEELRQKNIHELVILLDKQRKELQKVVADVFQRKEKNINKVKIERRNIAQVSTILNEKKVLASEVQK